MGLFDYFSNKTKATEPVPKMVGGGGSRQPKANVIMMGANVFTPVNPVFKKGFDGEKTTGQLGAVIDVVPIFHKLSLRSYELYAKNDLVKMLVDRKLQWSVGTGLKLEVEPNKDVLGMFDITIPASFYKNVEGLWKVYMGSKYVDKAKEINLHEIAWEVKKCATISGDTLVVCRIEDRFTVQIYSGQHLCSPDITSSEWEKLPEGHYLDNGIELNQNGEHVAYYVKMLDSKDELGVGCEIKRIEAVGKQSGKRLAWMVYADKLSHDHKRGVPDTMQVIEKANKLDRFNEAEVAGAEQRANIVYSIEHTKDSTGEDILSEFANKAIPGLQNADGEGEATTDTWVLADASAQRIGQATESTAINMPIGSSLKVLSSDKENNFTTFDETQSKKISASMSIPYEVALQSYNSNYSASRAAINGFGHMIDIDQTKFSNSFYKPIYQLWLDYMIKSNIIQAPGYLEASIRKQKTPTDIFILEAYTGCRFVGKKMPHIDPLKEVNAVRKMLGDPTKGEIPLISNEQGAEILNVGDWIENIEEYAEEIKNNSLKQVKDATINTTEESSNGLEQQGQV